MLLCLRQEDRFFGMVVPIAIGMECWNDGFSLAAGWKNWKSCMIIRFHFLIQISLSHAPPSARRAKQNASQYSSIPLFQSSSLPKLKEPK